MCATPMSNTMNPTTRVRRKWTAEEDQILRREAELQSLQGSPSDWKTIAAKIPSRSNKDCRKRWNKICTSINKGAWDASEDKLLRQAVMRYSFRWTQVAQMVGTRNAEQCAKRWHHSLDPTIDRSGWKEEEDACLLSAVAKYGQSWKAISEKEFPRRSKTDIKNRFAIITRRRRQAQSSAATRQESNSPISSDANGDTSDSEFEIDIDRPGDHGLKTSRASDLPIFSIPQSLSSPYSSPSQEEVLESIALANFGFGMHDHWTPENADFHQDAKETHGYDYSDHVVPSWHEDSLMTGNDWEMDAFSGKVSLNSGSPPVMQWEHELYEASGFGSMGETPPQTAGSCASIDSASSLRVTLVLEDVSSSRLNGILQTLLETKTKFKMETNH